MDPSVRIDIWTHRSTIHKKIDISTHWSQNGSIFSLGGGFGLVRPAQARSSPSPLSSKIVQNRIKTLDFRRKIDIWTQRSKNVSIFRPIGPQMYRYIDPLVPKWFYFLSGGRVCGGKARSGR